jgi:transposase-like protein
LPVTIATPHRRYPSAVACVADSLDALAVHVLFPAKHRKLRHANLIERTFGETRRRVKVIGRLPGEHSCLALVWAVLERASKGWRRLCRTCAATCSASHDHQHPRRWSPRLSPPPPPEDRSFR